MNKTEENLMEAFAGESQANRKYLAFATQAEKEGYPQIARLFRAAASAETVHAHAHLRAIKGVGNTIENLKEAIAGETHEYREMYPPMIEEAEKEGHKAGLLSFRYANEVEKIHAEMYQKALDDPQGLEEFDYYICKVCGHTHEKEAPEKCPICGAGQNAYFKSE